jgi:mono/diheme cytochrome c family protein
MSAVSWPSRPTFHREKARRAGSGLLHLCVLLVCLALEVVPANAQQWERVGSLFRERCAMCHSGADAPLGLELDSHGGVVKGSERGPVIRARDVGESELLRRLRGESEPAMPLVGDRLSEEELALVEYWIAEGAPAWSSREEGATATANDGGIPTYAHVEPIFLKRCAVCHSPVGRLGAPPEGLRLDSYDAILAGGERLALLPGNPDASEIIRRVTGKASPAMPLRAPRLSDAEIELLRRWVGAGARDADGVAASIPVGRAVRYRGVLTDRWAIDNVPFRVVAGTRIDGTPAIGERAEMRGRVAEDGTLGATRLRRR